ncbi:hypothetical protein QTP70_020282 [Hemibagrus guttatus]|uniref:Uncharacterized protein n=1 Tax=Hemibagrus guttatus TaxID=175788 RepID=A0AAE0PWS6_9TELE|nr:hypothetical protein QTP70_020282 [Hemibagrus guttatus]
MLRRWIKLGRIHARASRQPRSKRWRAPPKRMVLPFLKKSRSGQLCVRKNQAIVNSEIGGFFKCLRKLSKGHEKNRRELSPSMLPSEWEQNNMEDNEEDDEDIKKVDTDCFIFSSNKRNRQIWLPCLKWKTRQDPRKCTEQSKKAAEDLMELQDDTDIYNESSLINMEESHSRKTFRVIPGKRSHKSPASSSLSPCSTPCCLSPEKSSFVQNLFMDLQQEHTENQPQVLVTCSQSQPLDWQQTQKIDKACENLMEPINEMAIAESQWPSSADHDDDETQILEVNPMDRHREDDALCLENVSSHEHQGQNEDIHEGVRHEPVENEDLGSVSGDFISSQDLFQEPNNQASPLKETDEKIFKSFVVLPDIGLLMKNKGCSLILADMEGDYVKYSKSQRTPPSEISQTDGEIDHEKNKKTSDDSVEHMRPLMPLEDYTTGSRGSDYSSPSKDVLMVRQEEKTETPLFKYGGIKFLKRKKAKKTEAPEISDNLPPVQDYPCQNEDSAPQLDDTVRHRKRDKLKRVGLLEEQFDTLPEICVPTESSLSVQDSSMVCASVNGIKQKKKSKKDMNVGSLEEPVDTLQEISVSADSGLSIQDWSVVCASPGESKLKKKRKKGRNVGLLEEPVDTLQEISMSSDSGLPIQDSSLVCASVSGIKPKKERKKDKNVGSLEEPLDTLPEICVPTESSLSVQDSSLVCASVGGSNRKKKRKKDKHGQPVPQEDQWIGVEEAVQIPSQGSAYLVSKLLNGSDLSSPEVNQLDISAQAHKDHFQSDGHEAQKKKKKQTKKRKESSPVMSDELVDPKRTEESLTSFGNKTLKKKKRKFIDDVCEGQVGEMATASKNLGEPLHQILQAGVEIQPVNNGDLMTDDFVTPRKKKKRKKQEAVREENADVVETTEQVETLDTFQDSEQKAAEVVQVKKQKKKKHRTETCQEEEVSKNAAVVSLGPGDTATSNTPSAKSETGGIEEEEGLGASEPGKKKKKKKKRKEMDSDESWSVSRGGIDEEEGLGASETGKKIKKKKKRKEMDIDESWSVSCGGIDEEEGLGASETGKKKKKKKRKEMDSDESWSVSHGGIDEEEGLGASETGKKKKKKKRKEMDSDESWSVSHRGIDEEEGLGASETGKKKKKKKRKEMDSDESWSVSRGGIDEEEGLGASEPVKKKKKKRKEMDSEESWSVPRGLEYLDNSHNEQTTVVKEASRSEQKLGKEHPAPCLEMELTNDVNKKKKRERTKGDDSEYSQQVLQSEDTIQPNGKKKKKKKKKDG